MRGFRLVAALICLSIAYFTSELRCIACTFPLREYVADFFGYYSYELDINGKNSWVVPFELGIEHHPLISVRLPGIDHALKFAVDSGSFDTVVQKSIGDRFPVVGSCETSGGGGKLFKADVVCLPELKLESLALQRVMAVKADFHFRDCGFEGFLGQNVLNHFSVTIDHGKRQILLRPPGSYEAPPGAITVRLHKDRLDPYDVSIGGDLPVVECKIDGHSEQFLLDTGSPVSVIPDSLCTEISKELKFRPMGKWFGDTVRPRAVHTFNNIEIGGFDVASPTIYIERGGKVPVLGNDFLHGFERITFDQAKGSVVFETYKEGFRRLGFFHTLGSAFMHTKQYEKAIEQFEKLFLAGAPDAQAFHCRGSAENWLEMHNEAIQDCTKSIDLLQSSRAYITRAASRIATGQDEAAMEDASRAIALDPMNAEPYYQRSLVRTRWNQTQLGIEDCNQAITLNSKYVRAYQQRAFLYRKCRKEDLAQADIRRADALIKAQNESSSSDMR